GVAITHRRDEHARGKVDPLVAVRIADVKALTLMPDDRRLAAHRRRLVAAQLFESRDRRPSRGRWDDPAGLRRHPGELSGASGETRDPLNLLPKTVRAPDENW